MTTADCRSETLEALTNSVLLTVDVTEEVIAEARQYGCNLIISHHPLIFTPLKRIAGGSETERCVASAVRAGIAIYSAHTSFDNVSWGVSHILAEKIGLTKIRVLAPLKGKALKDHHLCSRFPCRQGQGSALHCRCRSYWQL